MNIPTFFYASKNLMCSRICRHFLNEVGLSSRLEYSQLFGKFAIKTSSAKHTEIRLSLLQRHWIKN